MEYVLFLIIALLIVYIIYDKRIKIDPNVNHGLKTNGQVSTESLRNQSVDFYMITVKSFMEKVKDEFKNISINSYYYKKEYANILFDKSISEIENRKNFCVIGKKMFFHLLSDINDDLVDNKIIDIPSKEKTSHYIDMFSNDDFKKNEKYNDHIDKRKLPPDWDIRSKIILARDGCRCQCCGQRVQIGKSIICNVKNDLENYYAIENMVNLCYDCYFKIKRKDIMENVMEYQVYDGIFHIGDCASFRYHNKVYDSANSLIMKGLQPCDICQPCGTNNYLIKKHEYSYLKKLEKIHNDYFNSNTNLTVMYNKRVIMEKYNLN